MIISTIQTLYIYTYNQAIAEKTIGIFDKKQFANGFILCALTRIDERSKKRINIFCPV